MHNKTQFSLVLLTTTILFASPALAVVVPGSAQSERTSERFRDVSRPEVGGASVIESAEEKGKVKIAKGAKFTLKAVTFEGGSGIAQEELQKTVESYVGQQVSLATLNEMTGKVTSFVRNKGYILSRAVLPPQTVGGNGAVKIRIIEGYVNSVTFSGDAASGGGVLSEMAEKIRNSKPLKAADLERYLLLMEDLPGVSARASIKPAVGAPAGASDVIVNITQKPIDLSATVDNRGSRFLGPFQASTSFASNNLFGIYDRTQLRLISSAFDDELKYGEVVHEQQIGAEGTKAVFSASLTDANPGHTLEVFDIESQTRAFAAAVRHPFLRSRQDNIYGTLEATVRDTDVTTLGSRLYNDRTRTLSATGAYDFVDQFRGINKTDISITQGFDIFNTDPAGGLISRVDGEVNFTKLNASVSHLQPIYGPFSVLGSAAGQFSFDPLLASEEFGLGGEQFASAYDPSEVTGDHGAAAKIELQYNQFETFDWLQYYQLYAYYDAGKVWNKGNVSVDDSTPLTSTGLGVRFNMLTSVSGTVDVALPINRPVAANGQDGYGPRGFFSLAVRY